MNMRILQKIPAGVQSVRRWASVLALAAAGTLSVANGADITNTLVNVGPGTVAFTNGLTTLVSLQGSNEYKLITAIPSANYMFTGWSGPAAPYIDEPGPAGTNAWLTFLLPNAVGIATFVQSTKLTVLTVPPLGYVSVNGESFLDGAQTVLPRASTNVVSAFLTRVIGGVTYDFDHWEKQNINLDFGATANPNSISFSSSAATLTAVYLPHVDTVQLTLKSQAGGTASLLYGTNTYTAPPDKIVLVSKGSTVSLSAAAGAGFFFTGWDDGTDGNWLVLPGFNAFVSAPQNVTVAAGSTFRATYRPGYTVTHHEPNGPGTADLFPAQLVTNGVSATVQVPTLTVPAGASRYICVGYTNFTPTSGFPAPAANVTSFVIANPTNNYQVRWRWGTEYRINISGAVGGTVSFNGTDAQGNSVGGSLTVGMTTNVWVGSGSTLNLTASPSAGYSFARWTRGVSVFFTASLSDIIAGFASYIPTFVLQNPESDWYNKFGLSPTGPGDAGPDGDPDGDGLSTRTEYLIYLSLTNFPARAAKISPIKCDSDGDGIDDEYEYNHIIDTNNVGSSGNQKNALAMTSPGGDFGPTGNPDGDFHWDTTLGYLTTQPLSNMEEYTGPDACKPFVFVSVPPGGVVADARLSAGYVYREDWGILDATPSGGLWTNTLAVTVIRMAPDLTDTADSSFSDTSFTGDDKMDDGFKWSWDLWQSNHVGQTIVNTNIWILITNTVPPWATSRIFKPSGSFVEPAGGAPSYDVWYNPVLKGGVPAGARRSGWVTVMDKYQASTIVTSNAFPVVRQNPPPGNPPWCVNPFLWDTDGDGLPDGWELTFGYDPWTAHSLGIKGTDDGHDNPSGKWYAYDGGAAWNAPGAKRHNQVYLAYGYDPRTGYGYSNPLRTFPGATTTAQFINLEAIRGDGAGPFFPGVYTDDHPVSPYAYDSDGDGIWDGWEFYVGLDPADPSDGALNIDADGLSAYQEFQSYNTSTNVEAGRTYVDGWRNKLMPTDPNDGDTDFDQLSDGGEKVAFNYTSNGLAQIEIDTNTMEIVALSFEGAGLNPTSADTDGDHLPDAWESKYAGRFGATTIPITTTNVVTTTNTSGATIIVTNIASAVGTTNAWSGGMNGTTVDDKADYDGDGLVNYQEYLCGAVYNWQFKYNNKNTAWVDGKGLYGYEPYDFFDPTMSGNQWYNGPGGREPRTWDPHYRIGPISHRIPWCFITGAQVAVLAAPPRIGLWFSSSDPSKIDTDQDGMDDYWEVFHGLNPLFGTLDIVNGKLYGQDVPVPSLPIHGVWMSSVNILRYPWIAGHQSMDPDQDGLNNIEESIQKDVPSDEPQYSHTDPSPLWMTDFSSPDSWANLYYWTGNRFAAGMVEWYWDPLTLADPINFPAPSYFFSFEANEGFDTDNDNIGDKAEIRGDTTVTTGVTDPLNGQSPIKRRALYLNGNAAARTRDPHFVTQTEFRDFTVEAWARPENPKAGHGQVIVDRSFLMPQGSFLGGPGLRHNFQLGIDAQGLPYATYDNAEGSPITASPVASASSVMRANEWAHLACTFDGHYDSRSNWVGALQLYKDGNLVANTPSSLIPANGWGESYNTIPPFVWLRFNAPIVVGASDNNPNGWVDGTGILVPPYGPSSPHSQPALANFFQGWLDCISLWDGARSQDQIRTDKATRMTRSQVAQAATLPSATVLKAYYTFNNRPDPDHSPVSPAGFQVLNEYPASYLNVPWWTLAANRSLVYDDYRYVPWLENMVAHIPLVPSRDGIGVATNGVFRNTANPYGLWYRHNSTGFREGHPQRGSGAASTDSIWALKSNPTVPDLLPLRWAVTDEDVPMWDGGGTPATDPYDSDKDGLPDAWEEMFGLDPLDPNGVNGTYGDPDADGMNNWAEFEAGTSPVNWDSVGTGAPDFFSWAATNTYPIIYGERFTDHDFMEDSWELAHYVHDKLDPRRYDAHMDADIDGWSNYSEFRAGTDPTAPNSHPVPNVTGTATYNGFKTGGQLVVHAYQNPDMEGNPFVGVGVGLGRNNWTFSLNANAIVFVNGEALGAFPINVGNLNNGNIEPGTFSITPTPAPNPPWWVTDDGNGHLVANGAFFGNGIVGTINYVTGAWRMQWMGYFVAAPGTTLSASYMYRPSIGMKEGPVYLHAFIDLNGNGRFDTGEPAGIGLGQPFDLTWTDLTGIEIAMTDNALGYSRFSWAVPASILPSRVQISSTALGAASPLTRFISPARSFMNEQDFIQLGYINGLPPGSYTWTLFQQSLAGQFTTMTNGVFAFAYGAIAAPALGAPIGGEERLYTRTTFKFAADGDSTTVRVRLRIYSGTTTGGPLVYDSTERLPYQRQDGYRYLLAQNLYFGGPGFGNGPYTWTLEGLNGSGITALSAGGTFIVNIPSVPQTIINPLGPFMFAGALNYYGRVTGSGNFVVEASLSPAFAGQPDGRLVIPNPATLGAIPTNSFDFLMSGLPGGAYYVRAYFDQNGNRRLDPTDTRGYLMSAASFYTPITVDVRNFNSKQTIMLSAADTDNDMIPDEWEIATTGGLGSMGVGTYAVMNAMGASFFMTDLEWARYSTMNLNPDDPNAAGLDGIPVRIKAAFGMNIYAPYQFAISGVTTDTNGMPVVIWAKELLGVPLATSSGYQIMRNGVTLTYKVQYSQDLKTWNDVSGAMPDGPVKYDANAGLFRYVGAPTSCPYFYRVQIAW